MVRPVDRPAPQWTFEAEPVRPAVAIETAPAPDVELTKGAPKRPPLAASAQKFLAKNPDLTTLIAGHRSFDTCAGYREHSMTVTLPARAGQIMQALVTSKPDDLWRGSSRYQLTYDRTSGRTYHRGDAHPPLREGMVILLELDIALGLKIPVGFEIVTVDPKRGEFAFSYVTKNKSQGIQRLTVREGADGSSEVVHESRFKSDSKLRDRFLYPPFHAKLLREFYAALGQQLSSAQRDSSAR